MRHKLAGRKEGTRKNEPIEERKKKAGRTMDFGGKNWGFLNPSILPLKCLTCQTLLYIFFNSSNFQRG